MKKQQMRSMYLTVAALAFTACNAGAQTQNSKDSGQGAEADPMSMAALPLLSAMPTAKVPNMLPMEMSAMRRSLMSQIGSINGMIAGGQAPQAQWDQRQIHQMRALGLQPEVNICTDGGTTAPSGTRQRTGSINKSCIVYGAVIGGY